MELWCFVTLGFHCMRVPEVYNEQPVITFGDGDYLRMDVRLGYLPYEYETYAIQLITSSKHRTITYSFIDENNTVIVQQPLIRQWTDAVVRIILYPRMAKKSLIYDLATLIYTEDSEYIMNSACVRKRCAIDLAWLKSYPPGDDESTYRYTAASIKKQPHVVSFKNKDLLTVALGFNNTPNTIYHVYLVFAYGREDNSQKFVSGINSNQKLVLNETFDQAYLKIQLCTDKPCGVYNMFPVIYLHYDLSRTETTILSIYVPPNSSVRIVVFLFGDNTAGVMTSIEAFHLSPHDQNCLANRCNIILDFGDEESHENSSDESATGSVVKNETGFNKNTVIVCSCVVVVILLLVVIIGICRRFKKRVNPNERAENIMFRRPMDLPPEVEYEEVYSHGAGLRRPRRQKGRGAAPQHPQH